MIHHARISGILFLTAMAASLAGGSLIEMVLNNPGFPRNIPEQTILLSAGIGLELINSIAVIGIAMMLYPVLKQFRESIGIGYVGFRIIESLFCILNAFIPLIIISMGPEFTMPGNPDYPGYAVISSFLVSARNTSAGLLVPLFFSIGALLLYFSLYRTKLVPRYISVWGIAAVGLLLALNLFGTQPILAMFLALPIIMNEIYLGIWLIVKGFKAGN